MSLIVRNKRGQFTKVLYPRTDVVFSGFAKKVIGQAKRNLQREKMNKGKLYKSLRADVLQKKDDFILRFFSTDYGDFVNEGVQGVDRTKNRAKGSPYKYKRKIPPPSILQRWAKMKGIKGRDKGYTKKDGTKVKGTGRFITDKSLGFAIANSIFQKGLKRTLFYDKAFDKYYKTPFRDEVETAFAEDVEEILANGLQQEFNK